MHYNRENGLFIDSSSGFLCFYSVRSSVRMYCAYQMEYTNFDCNGCTMLCSPVLSNLYRNQKKQTEPIRFRANEMNKNSSAHPKVAVVNLSTLCCVEINRSNLINWFEERNHISFKSNINSSFATQFFVLFYCKLGSLVYQVIFLFPTAYDGKCIDVFCNYKTALFLYKEHATKAEA